jgi:hypothetical protein
MLGVKLREYGANDPEKRTSAIRLIFMCKACFVAVMEELFSQDAWNEQCQIWLINSDEGECLNEQTVQWQMWGSQITLVVASVAETLGATWYSLRFP